MSSEHLIDKLRRNDSLEQAEREEIIKDLEELNRIKQAVLDVFLKRSRP